MNDKKKLDMDVIAHTVARFLTIVTRGGVANGYLYLCHQFS